MFEPLALRDEHTSPGLVVVRLGARTLDDEVLRRSVDECHDRWGIWGFSVLEVPGGDYEQLVRMRPIAAGESLINDGFPLLPTLDSPHWTLVLAAATSEQFERVRTHFRGPLDNPVYRSRQR